MYELAKRHRYEIEVLRRQIKHRRPKPVPNNLCRGIDLTTVRHCLPLANGRIERFLDTSKSKVKQRSFFDGEQLSRALPEFLVWYNSIGSHANLGGKIPMEA